MFRRASVILLSLVSGSCTPDGLFSAPDVSVISIPAVAPIAVNEEVPLTASVLRSNGATLTGATIRWESTQPAVATVNAQGRVRGVAPGTATIVASFAGVSGSVSIQVLGVGACASTSLLLGQEYAGALTSGDCTYQGGAPFFDAYRLTQAGTTTIGTRLTSSAFVPATTVRSLGSTIGVVGSGARSSTGTYDAEWLLPASTYDFEVSRNGSLGSATGAYQFLVTPILTDTTSCGRDVYAGRGVTATRAISSNDCSGSRGREDRIFVFLTQGQVLTATMTAGFDAYLLLYNGAGSTQITSDDDGAGGTNSRIVYTAPTSGYYQVRPTVFSSSSVGSYTLTLSW